MSMAEGTSRERNFSGKGTEKAKLNASYHKFPSSKKTLETEQAVIGGQRKVQIIQYNTLFLPIEPKVSSSGSYSEPSIFCSVHSKTKVYKSDKARYFSVADDHTKVFSCIDCAFSKTIKNSTLNIEHNLTKSERTKKFSLENFLRRIDLFQGCITRNLETNKRKIEESQMRYENDVAKIETFFEHLGRILNEAYTK